MGLFRKKTVTKTYDKENKKPVIKASICKGEQVIVMVRKKTISHITKALEMTTEEM